MADLTILALTTPSWHTLFIGIVVGIATGSVYALVALSFTFVVASCGVFNLTINCVLTTSIVVSYLLGSRSDWPPLLVAPLVMLMGAAIGIFAQTIGVARILALRTADVAHDTMVSTLGLGLAGISLVAIIFGTRIYPVDSYVSSNPVVVFDIPIRPAYIVMTCAVLVVAIGVELFLRFTEFGIVTRAVIGSNEGASLMGISVERVVQGAFMSSGAMAGLAGFLIAPVVSASAFVGELIMYFGFASIAIGGFASFRGAIVGGLIVGQIMGVTPAFVDAQWGPPLVWVTMVIVLFIRPAGLFGRGGQFGATSVRQV